MLTLGVDTSTSIGAVGLIKDNEILGEINIRLEHRHSERILPNINHLLQESGYKISDLEGIGVTVGPGSFTGLRIGLSTVKSFAQYLEIPIIGLSTLEVLAYSNYPREGWIVPVLDARRKRVYSSLYAGDKIGIDNSKIWEDQAIAVETLIRDLKELDPAGSFFFVGEGAQVYRDEFKSSDLNLIIAPQNKNLPRGSVVAELGQFYLEQGKQDNLVQLTPNYLKKPQAEINWKRKYKDR